MQTIIDKINKLRQLSTSNNIHEAAAAAAAANKLIDQYRLSEADLELTSQKSEEEIEEDSEIAYETGKITEWKRLLLTYISNHYGCYLYNNIDRTTGRKVSKYKLIGRRSDIAITKYMFNWLLLECSRLSLQEAKGKGRVYVASYCLGFTHGVNKQLQSSRQEITTTASNALVKLNNRRTEAELFAFKNISGLKSIRASSSASLNHAGYFAGNEKGKNIHLGATIAPTEVGGKLLK